MTDYAKQIDVLQRWRDGDTGGQDSLYAAITAAIELMRAAQPKSAEEERACCFKSATEAWTRIEDEEGFSLTEYIESERAAARAEGYAQGASDGCVCEPAMAANRRLHGELTAAQAEVERSTRRIQNQDMMLLQNNALIASLQEKLGGTRAEIERLRAELASKSAFVANAVSACNFAGRERDELTTKLTNLRAAAERKLKSPRGRDVDRDLLTAIEASR